MFNVNCNPAIIGLIEKAKQIRELPLMKTVRAIISAIYDRHYCGSRHYYFAQAILKPLV